MSACGNTWAQFFFFLDMIIFSIRQCDFSRAINISLISLLLKRDIDPLTVQVTVPLPSLFQTVLHVIDAATDNNTPMSELNLDAMKAFDILE